MRLGQLARKLAISPTEIIKFLESNQIPALEGSNTRLEDSYINLILQHFDPVGTVQIISEQTDENEKNEPVSEIAVDTAIVAEPPPAAAFEAEIAPEPAAPVEWPATPDAGDGTHGDPEKTDVIKAPKVALAGLKVLGKIDLPEPKKKESAPENPADTPGDNMPAERQPRRDGERREGTNRDGRRPSRTDQRRGNDKPRKNPVAQQREREAHEAQLKREAQAKADKERRTQHYYKKVKASVPTKPARLIHEHVVDLTDDQASTPTTWLGKFWRWFRS
jgi:hypothetical protein